MLVGCRSVLEIQCFFLIMADSCRQARGWPQNTKCRGTVADVAGFTKETAYWLKSTWLSNISKSDPGRPINGVIDDDETTVYLTWA